MKTRITKHRLLFPSRGGRRIGKTKIPMPLSILVAIDFSVLICLPNDREVSNNYPYRLTMVI